MFSQVSNENQHSDNFGLGRPGGHFGQSQRAHWVRIGPNPVTLVSRLFASVRYGHWPHEFGRFRPSETTGYSVCLLVYTPTLKKNRDIRLWSFFFFRAFFFKYVFVFCESFSCFIEFFIYNFGTEVAYLSEHPKHMGNIHGKSTTKK